MEKSTKVLIATAIALLLVVVGVVAYTAPAKTAVVLPKETQVQVTPVDTKPAAETVDLITIDNPFGGGNSVAATKLVTLDDGKFSSLTSYTEYHVTTSEFKLPSDFTDIGTEFTTMTSDQPIAISQLLTFDNDSVITWPSATTDTNLFTWQEHPDHLFVKQGDKVVISYSSNDGGVHWIGGVITNK